MSMSSVEKSKFVKVSEGRIVSMTFEQCRSFFKKMVYKEIMVLNNKMYNTLDEEDLKQELDIELWRAFEKYDINRNTCFSTFLYYRLKKGSSLVLKKLFAKKNDSNGMIYSLEAENEDGFSLEDVQADRKTSFIESDVAALEMYKCLVDSCKTEKEKELLEIIINKQSKLNIYAERHGITPQAASRQVKVMRQRLRYILKSKNFIK